MRQAAFPDNYRLYSSDVVLETKVLVSRRLEDKNTSLVLVLKPKVSVLVLVLTKSLEHFQAFFRR